MAWLYRLRRRPSRMKVAVVACYQLAVGLTVYFTVELMLISAPYNVSSERTHRYILRRPNIYT